MNQAVNRTDGGDVALRVGISTRALFDLEEEHLVFAAQGLCAYERMQAEREALAPAQGAGLDIVRRLLGFNRDARAPLVDVVLISRNAPDQASRFFDAAARHGLAIRTGSFTGGRPIAPLVKAWDLDLFLSNDARDVAAAISEGVAGARLFAPNAAMSEGDNGDLRIAFDGDCVLFGGESEAVFERDGLEAFLAHEARNADQPMPPGPFARFLKALCSLRERMDDAGRLRLAIVTSRSAPAHARVVRTLRAWGRPADEAHFVGTSQKAPILAAFGAHIFFDDREEHVGAAAVQMVAGLVPRSQAPEASRPATVLRRRF